MIFSGYLLLFTGLAPVTFFRLTLWKDAMLNELKTFTTRRINVLYAASWLVMATVLYLGILPLPWVTLPGQGLSLTLNILVWMWLSIAGAMLLLKSNMCRIRGGRLAVFLLAGCTLMSLPLIWTATGSILLSLYRLTGLWALAFFFILLMQFPLRGCLRRGLYAIVVFACLVQVFLSVWQIVFPLSAGEHLFYSFRGANGRPLGSLLHVNLLGSFLTTGLGCALWLALTARSYAFSMAMMLCACVLCAGVVITESRSAWLAAFVICPFLLMGFAKYKPRLLIGVILFLSAGILAGHVGLSLRPVDLNSLMVPEISTTSADYRPTDVSERLDLHRHHSGQERIAMLRGTIEIIKAHPLTGTGLSSFEVRFPEYLAQSGVDNPFTVSVPFPHNEILYVWSEGGVIALTGLLIWLGVWLIPFHSLLNRRRISLTACRGALTLPIMIHIMLEYPLYQSMIHAFTLLLLVRLALPVTFVRSATRFAHKSVRIAGLGVSAACMTFMITGLQSSRMIQEAESFRLMDDMPLQQVMNPFAQPERLRFDNAVYALVQYNFTQNHDWLNVFQRQASQWLQHHNDASMTASMIQLAEMRNDGATAEKWRLRACLSFQRDPRFDCSSSSSNRK
ncbi:putative membrane protein [Enterobacter sp. J49]|nr:putative membrane protein [Enterobacter sp. J49]